MKLYNLVYIEDYKRFVSEILDLDQPIHIYSSEENPSLILVSQTPESDPERLIIELVEQKRVQDIVSEDDALFDYSDDSEMGLIF